MTQTKADKLNLIVTLIDRAGVAGMTRRQFAKELGVKNSPYLHSLLQQVIDAGFMTAQMNTESYPPRWHYITTAKE